MIKRFIYVLICCSLVLAFPFSAFADDPDNSISGDFSDQGTSVEVTQLRISASDTSGLHSVILGLIGDYNPIVKDYTYTTTSYNGQVTTNHSIDIQPDWSWICTCAIFLIIVFCIFRLIGGLFSSR